MRWRFGALVVALGCADFETPIDPAGGAPDVLVPNPSFAQDVQPILEIRCATGGCHSPGTRQAGLVLAPASAYDALVNAPATLRPGQFRVVPAQPDQSWLVAMIVPDASGRGTTSRMPLASQPLTSNQIATIVRWIEQGAARN